MISDFIWGVRDTVEAALGGLDIEMPVTQHYGRLLEQAVTESRVDEEVIDEAVSRILRVKLRFPCGRGILSGAFDGLPRTLCAGQGGGDKINRFAQK